MGRVISKFKNEQRLPSSLIDIEVPLKCSDTADAKDIREAVNGTDVTAGTS